MARKNAEKPSIQANWKQWVAENKILGVSDEAIINTLVNNGIAKSVAKSEVEIASVHPYVAAGHNLLEPLKKYQGLMNLQNELASLSPSFRQIYVEDRPSQNKFLDLYYSKNRPVVLTGVMDNWKALSLWTPEYLKSKYGSEMVEIQFGRNSDPTYEENSESLKKQISFGEYLDMVAQGGETNDYYMTANNHVIEKEGMKSLLNDIEMFPEYLRPDHRPSELFFWYGPAGTITPLHHDRQNIFMAQVSGRKLVKLIPPSQTHLVYNHRTVFSRVDCENPDFNRFPLFRNANVITGILNPGQVLFLPNGWWHYVRALDVSLTVTFTNFVFPNPIFNW